MNSLPTTCMRKNQYIKTISSNKNNNTNLLTLEEIYNNYVEMEIKWKLTHTKPSPWLHHYHDN